MIVTKKSYTKGKTHSLSKKTRSSKRHHNGKKHVGKFSVKGMRKSGSSGSMRGSGKLGRSGKSGSRKNSISSRSSGSSTNSHTTGKTRFSEAAHDVKSRLKALGNFFSTRSTKKPVESPPLKFVLGTNESNLEPNLLSIKNEKLLKRFFPNPKYISASEVPYINNGTPKDFVPGTMPTYVKYQNPGTVYEYKYGKPPQNNVNNGNKNKPVFPKPVYTLGSAKENTYDTEKGSSTTNNPFGHVYTLATDTIKPEYVMATGSSNTNSGNYFTFAPNANSKRSSNNSTGAFPGNKNSASSLAEVLSAQSVKTQPLTKTQTITTQPIKELIDPPLFRYLSSMGKTNSSIVQIFDRKTGEYRGINTSKDSSENDLFNVYKKQNIMTHALKPNDERSKIESIFTEGYNTISTKNDSKTKVDKYIKNLKQIEINFNKLNEDFIISPENKAKYEQYKAAYEKEYKAEIINYIAKQVNLLKIAKTKENLVSKQSDEDIISSVIKNISSQYNYELSEEDKKNVLKSLKQRENYNNKKAKKAKAQEIAKAMANAIKARVDAKDAKTIIDGNFIEFNT